jgi:uncharacterized protein involved in tolerance to divalent cations
MSKLIIEKKLGACVNLVWANSEYIFLERKIEEPKSG